LLAINQQIDYSLIWAALHKMQ